MKKLLFLSITSLVLASLVTFPQLISRAQPTPYQRPYGPRAPWNIPVNGLALHPEAAKYSQLHWNYSPDRAGNFNLRFTKYTYPVYETADATDTYTITTEYDTNINGTSIPWNPSWIPASGTDAQIILLDPTTGKEWNLWQVRPNIVNRTLRATNGNLIEKGVFRGDNPAPADYRMKENGFRHSRGIGIQYLAMLVRPEEVQAGVIRHALSMPVKNTRYGPLNDRNGFCVAPATKIEHDTSRQNVSLANTIPEGMRFYADITDADIDRWIQSLPAELPTATKTSARVIAVALREYGWFITDTSGSAGWQFEDYLTAEQAWRALGLDEREIAGKRYPSDLMDGLLTADKIRTVVPSDNYPGILPTGCPILVQHSPSQAPPLSSPTPVQITPTPTLHIMIPTVTTAPTPDIPPTATPSRLPPLPSSSERVIILPIQSVQASQFEKGYSPEFAIDADSTTRWSASGSGVWFQADLGRLLPVSRIGIDWYRGDIRQTRFAVEVSVDGTAWNTIRSPRSSGRKAGEIAFRIPVQYVRFVRIVGYGTTDDTLETSIEELRIGVSKALWERFQ